MTDKTLHQESKMSEQIFFNPEPEKAHSDFKITLEFHETKGFTGKRRCTCSFCQTENYVNTVLHRFIYGRHENQSARNNS